MTRAEQAMAYFQDGLNCSQSVCLAFAEQFGIERDTALKFAAGFGGGIGRMAETCGAVTGAVMALGLKYGFTQGSPEAKTAMYAHVQQFAERFTERYHSMFCRELLGYDISIHEEHEKAKQEKLFTTRCPEFVRAAVEIVEEMLNAQEAASDTRHQ